MQVQVRHLLTSVFAVVDDNSIPFVKFFYFGDFGNSNHQFTKNFLMSLFSASDADQSIFLFRNDENVYGGLRVYISKGEDVIVFVNDG